jgi:ADP-ribose pyrophosphatase YjhB (NUDIX family)
MKYVSRVIISDGERVLLGKRSGGIESGKWNIFGGKPNANETPEETAKREIFEETQIRLTEIELLFTDQFNNWFSHYYLSIITNYSSSNIAEHSEAKWFNLTELNLIRNEIAFNHYLILKKFFGLLGTTNS